MVDTLVDENDGIDVGNVSLREAVQHVQKNADTNEVLFANALQNQTIVLDSTLGNLEINSNLTIDGQGKNISISGGGVTSIFKITGGDVTIRNLTLRDGLARGGDGGKPGRQVVHGAGGGGAGMG